MVGLKRLLAMLALAGSAVAAHAETILFVGNSFTFGAGSPVRLYRPQSVTDLNGDGIGGVPALFKRFADQAGLDYQVSLETSPGKDLRWHWDNRRAALDRPWDHVVLQDYSTLNKERPGDPAELIAYGARLADLFAAANPKVGVSLTATWSRPDLTYRPGSPWSGRGIAAMATDLRTAYDRAAASDRRIARVLPVGQAFTAAVNAGVADGNPYDGIAYGQVDLWTHDHYHASAEGYYLEALVVFAGVTGRDPRTLGEGELAASDLGLDPKVAAKLQQIAYQATARRN